MFWQNSVFGEGNRSNLINHMLLSAELRWFWQGACPEPIARWFFDGAKCPSDPEERIDRYLPQPGRQDIGIKTRGTKNDAEVKARIAIIEDATLIIAPSFEIWGKWDAALAIDAAIEVTKRRWLRAFDAEGREISGVGDSDYGCHLEWTQLTVNSQEWWTLGIEAFGAWGAIEDSLRKTVRQIEADKAALRTGASMAYPAWLDALN